MTQDTDLDKLLTAPLDAVADDGFSRQVAAKIALHERNLMIFEWAVIAVLAAFATAFLPIAGLLRPIATLAVELSLSLPFAVACAALALSYSVMRLIAD